MHEVLNVIPKPRAKYAAGVDTPIGIPGITAKCVQPWASNYVWFPKHCRSIAAAKGMGWLGVWSTPSCKAHALHVGDLGLIFGITEKNEEWDTQK